MQIAFAQPHPSVTAVTIFSSFCVLLSLSLSLSLAQQTCTLPLSSNGDTLWASAASPLLVRAVPPVVGDFRWGMTPTEVWNFARGDSNKTYTASEYSTTALWSATSGRDLVTGAMPLFGTTNSSQNANVVFFFNFNANRSPSLFRIEMRYYTPDPTITTDFVTKTQNTAKRTDFSANSQVQSIYEYRGSTVYSSVATFRQPSMTAVDFVNLGLGINLPLYIDPNQYGIQEQEFPGLACRGCSWPIPFLSGQVSPSIAGACPTTTTGWGAQIGYGCSIACAQTQASKIGNWTCTANTQTGLTQWDTNLQCTSGCTQSLPLNNSYSAGGTQYGSACPYPPTTTSYQLAEGASCSVLCNTDVAVAGESGFQCKSGQWVDLRRCQPQSTLPTCDALPPPTVGEGRASNCSVFLSVGHYAVGSRCSSYCLDGYQGTPSANDWECVTLAAPGGSFGTWQGGVTCTQAVCTSAPTASTGEDLTPCTTSFSYALLGASCSTKCASTYVGGGGLYTCSQTTVNGKPTVAWVGSANCTVAPKCTQPPPLNPGEDRANSPCGAALSNSQAPFAIGATCISDCASTYDGTAAAWTCTSKVTSATWVGGPLCTPKPKCRVPPLSLGEDRSAGTCGSAFATATTLFEGGFSCTSGCATGYVGTAAVWLCGTDGAWSAGGPQCRKPNACALADATNLGLVDLRAGSNPCLTGDQTRASATWPVGSNCTVGCTAGATGSEGTLTCTAALTWINSFQCKAVAPIACKTAPAAVLGVDLSAGDHPCQPTTASTSNTDGWTAEAECTAACGVDYSGSPAPFTCQADGTWSGGPTCTPASGNVVSVFCTDPPPSDTLMDFTVGTAPCAALVVGQRYNVGSVCSAGCNSSVSTGSTAVYQCQPTQPGSDTATWTGGPVCARSCIPSAIPPDSSINLSGGSSPCSSISGLSPGSSCTASCTLQPATVLAYRCNFVTGVWDLPASSSCPSLAGACLVSNLANQLGGQLNTNVGAIPCSSATAWQQNGQCTVSCANDPSSTTLAVTCGSGSAWVIPNDMANCNQSAISVSHLTLYDFPHATTKVVVAAAIAAGLSIAALATAIAVTPLAVGASNSVRGLQLVGFACCRESILLKVSYVYLGQNSFLFLCLIQIAISIGLLVAFGYQASIEAGWSMLLPRWVALGVYAGMVGLGIFAVLVDRFCFQDYEAENANYGLIIPGEVEREGSGCCGCGCCASNHARNADGTICTLYCRNRVRSIAVFNFATRAASLCACVLTIINWSDMSAISWVLVIWHLTQGYIVLLATLLVITWILGEACRRVTEPVVWRLIIPRVYVRDTEIEAYQYLPDALEQQVEDNEDIQAMYEKRPKKFTYLHWLRRSSRTCWAWRKSYRRPTLEKKEKDLKGKSLDDSDPGLVVSKVPPTDPNKQSVAGSVATATATPATTTANLMDPSLLTTTTRTSTPNATPAVSLLSPASISRDQSLPVSRNNVPPPVIVEQTDAPATCTSACPAATEVPSHPTQLFVYDADDDDEAGWAQV